MQETARFFHQFAALLKAGIPVQQSLGMAGKDCSPRLQKVLREASLKIEMGQGLADALSSHYFDAWTLSLIRAAEYGGSLEETFERLAIATETHHKRQRLYRSTIFNVMLIVVGLGGLLSLILPKNLNFSLLLAALLLAMFCKLLFSVDENASKAFKQFTAKLPIIHSIVQAQSVLYFTELELPLRCGVPILQALELIQPRILDPELTKNLAIAARQIQAGKTLSQSLRGKLPALTLQMLRTGEETGNLEGMLGKLAEYYESDLERRLRQLEGMLRPLGILAAGILVLLLGMQGITSLLNALPKG